MRYGIIEAYHQELDPPGGKKLVWFDNSAHLLIWDEPETLARVIINVEAETQKPEQKRIVLR